jgi:hypothetical protein
MRNAIHVSRLVLVVVVALGVAAGAWAQTTGTGAFDKLSPGDQKIARALFEAQSAAQTSSSGGATPLTLDQIAAKKNHTGWGEVFKQMKAQGLVTDKNLGEVVSSFERHHPEVATKPDPSKPDKLEKPNKPEKPEKIEKPARPEKPGR